VPGYREVLLVFAALGVVAVLAFWRARPPRADATQLASPV
jgi:hypothetical protein